MSQKGYAGLSTQWDPHLSNNILDDLTLADGGGVSCFFVFQKLQERYLKREMKDLFKSSE